MGQWGLSPLSHFACRVRLLDGHLLRLGLGAPDDLAGRGLAKGADLDGVGALRELLEGLAQRLHRAGGGAQQAVEMLGGISIDMLAEGGFSSDITDDYEAILSIIGRHPMNQHEIQSFLANRNNNDSESIFERLNQNDKVERQDYKGYITYRLR